MSLVVDLYQLFDIYTVGHPETFHAFGRAKKAAGALKRP
jgi:hypothetical protein